MRFLLVLISLLSFFSFRAFSWTPLEDDKIIFKEFMINYLLTGLLLAELSESEELPLLDEEDEDPDEDEEDELPEDPEVLPLNLGLGGILITNL